jgi:hypothetical protein
LYLVRYYSREREEKGMMVGFSVYKIYLASILTLTSASLANLTILESWTALLAAWPSSSTAKIRRPESAIYKREIKYE